MKRIACVILTVVLCLSVFTACNEKKSGINEPNDKSVNEDTQTNPPENTSIGETDQTMNQTGESDASTVSENSPMVDIDNEPEKNEPTIPVTSSDEFEDETQSEEDVAIPTPPAGNIDDEDDNDQDWTEDEGNNDQDWVDGEDDPNDLGIF